MSEETTTPESNEGTWSGLKKTLIGTLTTVILGGGTWLTTTIFGGHGDDKEETKTVDVKTNVEEASAVEESETKPVSLQEFLNKSFECLFNQNVHLHRALAQVLQEEFKKQEDRKLELEEKIDALEKKLKEGFLYYTREIMKGLDDAN